MSIARRRQFPGDACCKHSIWWITEHLNIMSRNIELHSMAEREHETSQLRKHSNYSRVKQPRMMIGQYAMRNHKCVDILYRSYHIHVIHTYKHTCYVIQHKLFFFYFNGINEIAKFKYTCVKWSIIIICLLVNSFVQLARTHSPSKKKRCRIKSYLI